MGKRYVIEKALNNNILQIRDGETEKLFIGRGIGFGKKPGELFEKNSVVDKVFVIEDDKNQNNFKQIFRGDGPEFVDFCEELILLIARSFHEELHETIHISLIDHISCTLRRLKLGEQIVSAKSKPCMIKSFRLLGRCAEELRSAMMYPCPRERWVSSLFIFTRPGTTGS